MQPDFAPSQLVGAQSSLKFRQVFRRQDFIQSQTGGVKSRRDIQQNLFFSILRAVQESFQSLHMPMPELLFTQLAGSQSLRVPIRRQHRIQSEQVANFRIADRLSVKTAS